MYRIVASDMDETFLNYDAAIPEANLEAVHQMRQLGVHFVIATGRPYFSIAKDLEALGLAGNPDEFAITINGALVKACDGTVVGSHPLDPSIVGRLIDFAVDCDLCLHLYGPEATYVWNMNPDERDFLNGRMEVVELTLGQMRALECPIYKVLVENEDTQVLHDIRDQAFTQMPDLASKVETVFSSDRYVEFNTAGVSKGAGLKDVADRLGVPMQDTIAVGDAVNDLAMLKAAGAGCVVANVSDLLRPLLPNDTCYLHSNCAEGCMPEVLNDLIIPSMDK